MAHKGHTTLESMSQAVWYNTWTMKKFAPYLRGDILEIGCGFGNFTPSLLPYGHIWSIDIDDTCIQKTKQKIGRKGTIGFGNIETADYFFGNKKFDALICLNVLEHIQYDDQAMNNMYRLLKPGGHAIILVPAHRWLYGAIDIAIAHYRRYTREELREKLHASGFSIHVQRRLNALGSLGWFIAGKILQSTIVDSEHVKFFNYLAPLLLPLEDRFEPPIGTSLLIIAKK